MVEEHFCHQGCGHSYAPVPMVYEGKPKTSIQPEIAHSKSRRVVFPESMSQARRFAAQYKGRVDELTERLAKLSGEHDEALVKVGKLRMFIVGHTLSLDETLGYYCGTCRGGYGRRQAEVGHKGDCRLVKVLEETK